MTEVLLSTSYISLTLSDHRTRFDSNSEYTARKHPQRQAWAICLIRSPSPDVRSEVQIMRGIDHPSIVKLYAFSESAEHYYLILERQCSLSQVYFLSKFVVHK